MFCAREAMASDRGMSHRFCEPVYWHGLTLVNHGTQAEVLRGVEARPRSPHIGSSGTCWLKGHAAGAARECKLNPFLLCKWYSKGASDQMSFCALSAFTRAFLLACHSPDGEAHHTAGGMAGAGVHGAQGGQGAASL